MIDLKDAKRRYNCQKAACKNRFDRNGNSIEMKLSFEEWIDIWYKSGKWHLRGNGIGKYVMSRIDDLGHYEKGNVRIIESVKNSSEMGKRGKGRKMPEHVKQKLALIHNGAKRSEETKQKMSEARKGRAPWNKGIKTKEICR